MSHNPIIIALDFSDAAEARNLVTALGDPTDFYKVGMELYASAGMDFVRELIGRGKQVFLDLKMYDIGETVKRAVRQIPRAGVRFTTVHGSNAVLRAAVEGRGDSPLKLLGVTVLTSFDQEDLADLGFPCSLQDLVALRVKNAMAAGMDGVVCSPREAALARGIAGPDAIIVTPGVRSRTADAGDQKRISTPEEALAAGASYVVIGREVTRAADPRAQLSRIHSILVPSAAGL
jgi:orotidine-5'-phosphate decarboxylase